MLFRTHFLFGILAGLLFIQLFNPANQLLFMALILLGAIFPDIDNVKSTIGKFALIGFFFEHRGLFHSLLIAAALSLLLALFTDVYYAFALGYLTHLAADALTPMGVGFLYPFSNKRVRGFIKTGSLLEHILFIILLLCIVIYIL